MPPAIRRRLESPREQATLPDGRAARRVSRLTRELHPPAQTGGGLVVVGERWMVVLMGVSGHHVSDLFLRPVVVGHVDVLVACTMAS
jgi:hypothetical protein